MFPPKSFSAIISRLVVLLYASNDIKLTFESIKTEFNNKTYDKVDHVGNRLSGYYYLY